jgi:hypothetical protein
MVARAQSAAREHAVSTPVVFAAVLHGMQTCGLYADAKVVPKSI